MQSFAPIGFVDAVVFLFLACEELQGKLVR